MKKVDGHLDLVDDENSQIFADIYKIFLKVSQKVIIM